MSVPSGAKKFRRRNLRVEQPAVVRRHPVTGTSPAIELETSCAKIRDSFAASSAAGRACR